jgi:hypothetical protein
MQNEGTEAKIVFKVVINLVIPKVKSIVVSSIVALGLLLGTPSQVSLSMVFDPTVGGKTAASGAMAPKGNTTGQVRRPLRQWPQHVRPRKTSCRN